MKFCSLCANPVNYIIPAGDNRPRHICESCGTVHYQNPKIVAGCIPEWQNEILLCKRAIQPRLGYWTLPAGFMENGETTEEAAIRETLEETGAQANILQLYTLYSIPHISQVYMIYRAQLLDKNFSPTPESEQVELFSQQNIPWEQIAFPVIELTLKQYYQDQRNGSYQLKTGTIDKRNEK